MREQALQHDLFSLGNLACTVDLPQAPALSLHSWPFPGMTAEDSARAALALSDEFADLCAAVIKRRGGDVLTGAQVTAALPADWRTLLGPWATCALCHRTGAARGIKVQYVHHEGGGGFHFTYQATGDAHA